MKVLPHRYTVLSRLDTDGSVAVESEGLPPLLTTAPPAFDGPRDHWSPETLITASVSSCFLLTFRALARNAKVKWESLTSDTVGVLNRIDSDLQFTEFHIGAQLVITDAEQLEQANDLLNTAEATCLINNSLKARVLLHGGITIASEVA